LFKRGQHEMSAGHVSAACPLFAKSWEADKGLPVLFALAECEAKDGQAAAALEHYRLYEVGFGAAPAQEQAREAARKKAADARVAELERVVPELAIEEVPEGAIVRVDGRVVPLVAHVLVEPGDHIVVVEARDGRKIGQKVTVAAGEHAQIRVPIPDPPPPPPPPPEEARPEPAPPAPPPSSASSGPPTAWILGSGVVGVVGLAAGAILGVMAMERADVVDKHCSGVMCDHEGKSAADEGKALGWASTGAFALGIVGVGVAIVLFATSGGSSGKGARAFGPLVGGRLGAGARW
jgi:hypothetical protein